MKKRIIFSLVLCLSVLLTNNVFAAQETNITKDTLEEKTITSETIEPDHVVYFMNSTDIYQNYGMVGGQAYTQTTSIVEKIMILGYIYEGTTVRSIGTGNSLASTLLFL